MKDTIDRGSVVVAAEGQVSSDLAGETVILDVKSGIYYGLNGVATRIWQLIQEPCAVREVYETLLQEFEIDAERCEHEVLALLQDLAFKRLIEVKNEMDM